MIENNTVIHSFNTRDNILYQVISELIEYEEITKNQINSTFIKDFLKLKQILHNKSINYDDLKGSLIPLQKKTQREVLFIFDATMLSENDCDYGRFPNELIFRNLSLNKKRNFVVYTGDYIIHNEDIRRNFIKKFNDESTILNKLNESEKDYYFIYVKNLTENIVEDILKDPILKSTCFNGYIDCTNNLLVKTIISQFLPQNVLLYKDKAIYSTPDEDGINHSLIEYDKYGYKLIGILEPYYLLFLTYRIENLSFSNEELLNSINLIADKELNINDIELIFSSEKINYIKNNKNYNTKNGDKTNLKILDSGLYEYNDKQFHNFLQNSMLKGDPFNLKIFEYGYNFNIRVLIENDKKEIFSFIIAYNYDGEKFKYITMY